VPFLSLAQILLGSPDPRSAGPVQVPPVKLAATQLQTAGKPAEYGAPADGGESGRNGGDDEFVLFGMLSEDLSAY